MMMKDSLLSLQLTGLLAMLGALLYAVGDVLLLASKVRRDDYPQLKPFAKLLSDAEKMVVVPSQRLMWGALLGVFATPLVMVGYWQIYQGLAPHHGPLALITAGLLAIASVIGAFVHGTFYYMGGYVQALNKVEESSQPVIADMITRHRKVLTLSYAPVLIFLLIASLLFSVSVASGKTAFPIWMAAVNPVTLTVEWLLLKRLLPPFVRDWTEGAGFNIAFLLFFVCTTLTLWAA